MRLIAVSLAMFVMSSASVGLVRAASLDEGSKHGIKIVLPDRWDVARSDLAKEPWGESFEVKVTDDAKTEYFWVVVGNNSSDPLDTWVDRALNGPGGLIEFLTNSGKHIDKTSVAWTKKPGGAQAGSGEQATVMSTPTVRFTNGVQSNIQAAYFQAGKRYYLVCITNWGRLAPIDDTDNILRGIFATAVP